MTAIAGRRMAETVARRGGLVVIPQDIPLDVVTDVIAWVKQRHLVLDTPITLTPGQTVADALSLLPKRAHNAGVVVEDGRPVGVVTESDLTGVDRFTQLSEVMSRDLLLLDADIDPREAFNRLHAAHRRSPPPSTTTGGWSASSPARARCAPPCTPRPSTRAAPAGRRRRRDQRRRGGQGPALLDAGVDTLVVDTAHGHQEGMLEAVRAVRALDPRVPVVAGQRRRRRRQCATWSRPEPTSSRSGSGPARCAPPA